jgi:hypothetical protein
MNIHVVRTDGSWYARPDITLVRDADRFFLPDDCTGALACRCRCIRIDKAGKAIVPRFARRYFSNWAPSICFYGVLADGAVTPYLDRATWVDRDFQPVDTLQGDELQRMIEGLEHVSRHVSLRIGDFLMFELSLPIPLKRGDIIDTISVL